MPMRGVKEKGGPGTAAEKRLLQPGKALLLAISE